MTVLPLVLAALAAATPKAFSPADLVGRWSGRFECSSKMDGRVNLRFEKQGREVWARYSVTEGTKMTGRAPLTPEPGQTNVYRTTVKLDPDNPLRLKTLDILLTFTTNEAKKRVILHRADLGAMSRLGELSGRTELLKGPKLLTSHKTTSMLINDECSIRLQRLEDEEDE